MFRLTIALLVSLVCCLAVLGQGKGVDKQNERVRDSGTRAPANNGAKTDTGAGRGIDFGKGRTPGYAATAKSIPAHRPSVTFY